MKEISIYHQRHGLSKGNPSYTRLHMIKNEDGIHTHLHVSDLEVEEYETVEGRLEDAFIKSQNDNPSSDWKLKMMRSSMVGDIFVDKATATHWEVDFVGFSQL